MPVLTTVVGSYTRPSWLIAAKRALDRGEMSRDLFNELSRIAVRETVKAQVEAGVDQVSDGEQWRTSFWEYFVERIEGFAYEGVSYTFAGGTPRPGLAVTGRLKVKGNVSLDELKFVKGLTDRQVKVPCASASHIGVTKTLRLPKEVYPSEDAYHEDLCRLLREEYSRLLDAGASVVQLDIPDFSLFTMKPSEESKPSLRKSIELLNRSVEGLPRERLHAHICYGNYWAIHMADGSYLSLLPDIYDLRVGTLCLEMAGALHADDILLFKEYPPPKEKKIAVGVIDVKTPDVEPAWLVKKRLLRAAECIDAGQLAATTDCGFAPNWEIDVIPRSSCFLKLKSLAEGARQASAELGV